MWGPYNPNPRDRQASDCVIRAITKALDVSWGAAYWMLALKGFEEGDMPSINSTWGAFLEEHGFKRALLDRPCTVREFCEVHQSGIYVLATGSHVVTTIDGCWFDSWNSANEPVAYFFEEDD